MANLKPTYEPQTRFWQKISLIAEIAALCRENSPSKINFTRVLELIQPMIPFDSATLFICEDGSDQPVPIAVVGTPIQLTDGAFPVASDMDHVATLSATPSILLVEQEEVERYSPRSEHATLMIAPLVVSDGVIGRMVLGSYYRQVFQEKHVKLMAIVADQLALSIERQMHERRMEAKQQALEQAHQELKKAQLRIVEQEKLTAVTELSASINHEINNPLTTIVGNAQYLRLSGKVNRQQLDTRLQRIEQAGLRIAEVNRKLLSIGSLVSQDCHGLSNDRMLDLNNSARSGEDRE